MRASDFLSAGPLTGALCLLLGAGVTIHAARAGSFSRRWAALWLVTFFGLAVSVLWNGARDTAERRERESHDNERTQREEERWTKLFEQLGLPVVVSSTPAPTTSLPPPSITHLGLLRRLSPAEKRKFAVLVRAMGPYAAHIYHTRHPLSVAVAGDFAEVFKAADWQIRGNEQI